MMTLEQQQQQEHQKDGVGSVASPKVIGNAPCIHCVLKNADNLRQARYNGDKAMVKYEQQFFDKTQMSRCDCTPFIPYRDFSMAASEEIPLLLKDIDRKHRLKDSFPIKLHSILESSDLDESIVSWAKHGRAFKVHNRNLFCKKIMPLFSYQTQMASFIRQLSNYGFHKIVGESNIDKGSYYHELFLRGRGDLCAWIGRQKKKLMVVSPEVEPDLSKFGSVNTAINEVNTTNNQMEEKDKSVEFDSMRVGGSGGRVKRLLGTVKSPPSRKSDRSTSILNSRHVWEKFDNGKKLKCLNCDEVLAIDQLLSLKEAKIAVMTSPCPFIPYRDFSRISFKEVSSSASKDLVIDANNRPIENLFPVKLYSVLERSEIDGYSQIISWSEHGRSFKIYNRCLFCKKIMPLFSYQTQMASFTRQLSTYGFHKIVSEHNIDKGSYYHELFLRGRSDLCSLIARQRKQTLLISPQTEPDLTKFDPMPMSSSSQGSTHSTTV